MASQFPWIGLVLVAGLAAAAAAEEPFRVIELAVPGRAVAAGLADLDGDGRSDVYAVSLVGIPPRAGRELRVHFQEAGGVLPAAPQWTGAVPAGAAAYDVADVDGRPGAELLFLDRHAVATLSLAGRRARARPLVIPGDPTVAVAPDERGLDRLRLARAELPGWLVVPGLGEAILLGHAGELRGRLAVGHRSDFFVPARPGPLVGESEVEGYYDFPRLELGDVDGDGRTDLLAATRHELRVFRQGEDGRFPAAPSRRIALGRLSEADLVRGSGNVRVAGGDVNGDGRMDLLVTATTGGLLAARSETTLHLNRGGSWDLAVPDRRSVLERGWTSLQLLDLDGDGRPELLEARMPLGILATVELLLTREADVDLAIYRVSEDGGFEKKPWVEDDLHVGLDFGTLSTRGFVPRFEADLNGDGLLDRLESGDGEALEVTLGGGAAPLRRRSARQAVDTRGSIAFGDLDGDGLTDLLLFTPEVADVPLRLLVNRGVLPGTRPRLVPGP